MSTADLYVGRRSRLPVSHMPSPPSYFKAIELPLLFQPFGMPLQVIVHEGGDEIVGMIIALVHA